MIKSYSSSKLGLPGRIQEAVNLYRMHVRDMPEQVRELIEHLVECECVVEQHTGLRLENLDILDIGPGQKLRQIVYFAAKNRVTGIDLDLVPHGLALREYVRMLRQRGLVRSGKTAALKLAGIDRRFQQLLCAQLGLRRAPSLTLLQMDAARMQFEAGSFDFVYSFSVFEHLQDPEAVIREVVRVLRPGGGCLLSLHLYTSDNGCHDPRIFAGNREMLPLWSHLRPCYADRVMCNAYLNKLSLDEWRERFVRLMPGVQFLYDCYTQPELEQLRPELERIRAGGELTEYRDEELLTVNLVAVWKRSTTK